MTAALVELSPGDDVLVALEPLGAGMQVDGLKLLDAIRQGHKLARRAIAQGETVRKYGFPIGRASVAIPAGAHVHLHNLRSGLEDPETESISAKAEVRREHDEARSAPATFLGYRRADGRVGIRNEIWIINTVACVNSPAERIATLARERYVRPAGPISGVYAFSHPYGCSQLGDDLSHTRAVLTGLARHPNAAAVLILGLGCENNQLGAFLKALGDFDERRIKFFNAQDVGDEIETGLEVMDQLAAHAATFQRESVPASELVLGMKCGGSDGLSGLTANPLVGRISDWLGGQGGTALLTEVPEMFGAEAILLGRADSPAVAKKFRAMIGEFKDYFHRHHEPVNENPSPGNKEGGISTLEEKSLGCVQKGGTAPVREVIGYGEPAPLHLGGLGLVHAPGNDGVSITALAAAGAQMILFTTGRGTPLGAPVPTLKIASNSSLAERKPAWIDFDAGRLLTGVKMDELAVELRALVLRVASGEAQARNEVNGYREIAIWKDGVTL